MERINRRIQLYGWQQTTECCVEIENPAHLPRVAAIPTYHYSFSGKNSPIQQ